MYSTRVHSIGKGGKTIATRDDVAKLAGVSGATVSRVFNCPESVSEASRNIVLKAANELNYHPNLIAQNFAKGITGNIGIILPYIPNVHIFSVYYFSELLSGIGQVTSEKGFNIILFFHDLNLRYPNDYTKYFKGQRVDGCILLGTLRNDPGLIDLKKSGYRFCLVNNYIKGSGIDFADVDNVKGSYEAVKYLVEKGHKNIAFINGPSNYTNSIDRYQGYCMALDEFKIPLRKSFILEGNYGKKSGYIASKKLLDLNPVPSALFASNDRMAAGVIMGLREKGISIPEDMAVVGYDDSDIATIVEPNLTTVKIPFFELGKMCAARFLDTLSRKSGGFELKIEPELIVRQST